MKNYDIIAFDLDGTLTNPEGGLIEGYKYAFSKMNIPMTMSNHELRKYIGPPLISEWQRDFSLTDSEAERMIGYFREYYNVYGWWDNKPYENIDVVLKELREAGKTLITATSKPEITARKVLSLFGLDKYFDFIGGATFDTSRDKKHQVLEYSLATVGCTDKSRAILVGDRRFDAEGAAIVGIDSMGVLYGHGTREELLSENFVTVVDSVLDISRALLNK